MTDTKLTLKLLINKKAKKVLFAEAGKDFIDFLFNLLSLPVGTVVRLLTNATMVGCIGNLYGSLENLNEAYLNQNKDLLLNPCVQAPAIDVPLILPDTNLQPSIRKFYYCTYNHPCVTDQMNTKCRHCSYGMSEEVQFVGVNTGEGGYVKDLVTYMVTDDLSVPTLSMISAVGLLNKFKVKDFSVLEEKVVEFGIDEGLELLKASLLSKAALTSVFLAKEEVKDGATSTSIYVKL